MTYLNSSETLEMTISTSAVNSSTERICMDLLDWSNITKSQHTKKYKLFWNWKIFYKYSKHLLNCNRRSKNLFYWRLHITGPSRVDHRIISEIFGFEKCILDYWLHLNRIHRETKNQYRAYFSVMTDKCAL